MRGAGGGIIEIMAESQTNPQNTVARYYSRLGSWLGYNLVMRRSQHAGYWQADTKNERQAQWNFLEKLAELLQLKPGERVLDAGLGQGYAARYLAEETGAEIIGITITPREVVVSEKLSRRCKNPPKFMLGDYAQTDFPDGYFDAMYVTETLSHARDMAQTMREFYRILKPGGHVVFANYEINGEDASPEKLQLLDFLEKYAGGYGLRQQSPGAISAALREAGFVDTRETDWSQATKPTFDRLRRIARPLAWITPSSELAPYFVNAVMANHGFSTMYETDAFRYVVYEGRKGSDV